MSPGAGTAPTGGTTASLICPHCSLVFRRREHLSRHLDRHSGVRRYQCHTCKRNFPRRDTLKRHVGTHGAAALAEWTRQNEQSHPHACLACAKGKQRCDGDGLTDCSNCASRNRPCIYRGCVAQASLGAGDVISITERHETLPATDTDLRAPESSVFGDVPRSGDEGLQVEEAQSHAGEQTSVVQQADDMALSTTPYREHSWDDFLLPSRFSFPPSPLPSVAHNGPSDICFANDVSAAMGFDVHDHTIAYTGSLDAPLPSTIGRLNTPYEQESLSAEEEDVLVAEYIPHVPQISAETYASIVRYVENNLPQHEAGAMAVALPSLRHLDAYVQLYFEHFQPRMPLLHAPTFQSSPEPWMLILAVACLGCQYSSANLKARHMAVFHRLSLHIIKQDVKEFADTEPLQCMQALLLFHNALMLAGDRQSFVHLQLHRSILVTLCRQLLSQDGTILRTDPQPEEVSDPWLRWVRGEAKLRVLYFTWVTECLNATFFLLPPLLAMHELQISLPSPEQYWRSHRQQWLRLPTPQSSFPLCAALARIGVQNSVPEDVDEAAHLILLLSVSVQETADQDLKRAMMVPTYTINAVHDTLHTHFGTGYLHIAHEVLLQHGCSRPLTSVGIADISNDFSIIARIIRILTFTPARLLYPFSRWQTAESGSSKARLELLKILSQDIGRARQCAYEASQLFQHFRGIKALIYTDGFILLLCMLYMLLYIELAIPLQATLTSPHGEAAKTTTIIRLDQNINEDELQAWLSLRCHYRPHIAGIGCLDTDRSAVRLCKETARLMTESATTSGLARSLSAILTSLAMGNRPEFQEDQQPR